MGSVQGNRDCNYACDPERTVGSLSLIVVGCEIRVESNVYQYRSPSPFSKKAMQWGKQWPVRMNLSSFAVEAYVPGPGGTFRHFQECDLA